VRTKKSPGGLPTAKASNVEHDVERHVSTPNRQTKQPRYALPITGENGAQIALAVFTSAADARAYLLSGGNR
jgi:hypothetical protein